MTHYDDHESSDGVPDHPDLFALLRGELSNDETSEAGAHLAHCLDCPAELVELAVGNAFLSRAVRTERTERTDLGQEPTSLPTIPRLRRPRHRPSLLVAAATVAAIVGGIVGLTFLDRDQAGPGPDRSTYTSVRLDAVEGSASGEARLVGSAGNHTRVVIEAPALAGVQGGTFYYAWLLDPGTNKMLPLGQVGPGGKASFDLDNALLDSYSAIDVSLENDDGDPGHSVTSVLRGTYDASLVAPRP